MSLQNENDKEKFERFGQFVPLKEKVKDFATLNEVLIELLRYRDVKKKDAPQDLVNQALRFINAGFSNGLLYATGGEAFVFYAKNMLKEDVCVKISLPSYPGSEGKKSFTWWDKITGKCHLSMENVAEKRFIEGTKLQNCVYELIIQEKVEYFAVPKVLASNPNPLWVVMDWVNGVPITNWLGEQGNGILNAMYAFLNLTKAIAFLHNNNIIHRDIKPKNILIGERNKIFLVDWTFSKKICDPERNLTVKKVGLGTAPYTSPNQFESAVNASPADDLYSLGITFVAFVLGKEPPFPVNEKDNYSQLQAKFRSWVLSNRLFPHIFHNIFIKATNWDATERYRSTDEMVSDIEDLIFQLQETDEGKEILRLPDTLIPYYRIPPAVPLPNAIQDESDIQTVILPAQPASPALDPFSISIIVSELSKKFIDECSKKYKKQCSLSCADCDAFQKSIIRLICETIAHLKKGKYI